MRQSLPRLSNVIRALGGPEIRNGRIPAFWRGGTNATSVSTDDEQGVWYDNGAGMGGGVVDLVKVVLGCDREAAWRFLTERYDATADHASTVTAALERAPELRRVADNRARIAKALAVWRECTPLRGTAGEEYFRSRRLRVDGLDHAVRFHPRAPFDSGRYPCIVALIRDIATDEPCGVHRTALDDGGDKIARRMLGRARQAAIKLAEDADVALTLGIAEGIETALSIQQSCWGPVWALAGC